MRRTDPFAHRRHALAELDMDLLGREPAPPLADEPHPP